MAVVIHQEEGLPIAEVEQATGIARATLRIWERRYGFPRPGRDARGERTYPQEQVRKLRRIAELMMHGYRPGRLVQLAPEELAGLDLPGAPTHAGRDPASSAAADPVLEPLHHHDPLALRHALERRIRSSGLAGFVCQDMPRMNAVVGDAWSCGALEVFEEHMYTEAVQQLLRAHLAALPPARPGAPRVLLATLPEESHGLGLLMAQAMFTLEGWSCTSLGVRVPVGQVLAACQAMRPDVVGLSYTASANPAHVLRGLEQLRAELPQGMPLWCGGSSPVIARRRVPGVQYVAHVGDVVALSAPWRARLASVTDSSPAA
ncbi:MAG: putative transcriptional regulator, MerR family [Ramlibacter sp.]|jgi:methanogenic corrinoid protein MtbC1|nr:putative transcriptional regulator, MerR family [Ramlibacter sp.]